MHQRDFDIGQAFITAMSHLTSGNLAAAEALCWQITKADPRNAMGFQFLGLVLNQSGKFKEAVEPLRQAIKLKKGDAGFYLNLGIALKNTGEFSEAETVYKKALALQPGLMDAQTNLAALYRAQGKIDHAQKIYLNALKQAPNDAQLHYVAGVFLQDCNDIDTAVKTLERAVQLAPDFAEAHSELGALMAKLAQYDKALSLHQKALTLNPGLAPSYNNYAITLIDLERHNEAAAACRQGLTLPASDIDKASLYFNMGLALKHLKKISESLEAFERATALNPNSGLFMGALVHQLHHACAWEKIGQLEQTLINMSRAGQSGIQPFALMNCAKATQSDLLQVATLYSRRYDVQEAAQFKHAAKQKKEKLRIGYLSSDLHEHATAHLTAEMFERHDRNRFETFAYSYGIDDNSAMRQRLAKAFDHFHDIRMMSHQAAAKKIFDDGIDILIDLKGLTSNVRPQIMAYRPAPVQVQFLGYPATMGASFIDYIIADPIIIPPEDEKFYSEKVLRLPRCYQPNDTARKIGATPSRKDCGLPEEGFVFCSFNSAYKIQPEIFAIWMRLLKAVPGSVLWQLADTPLVMENLRKAAMAAGLDPVRLIFAPFTKPEDNLARQKMADLFLDTLPVNAHTTASDAIWAGLPLITCIGDRFAGRVAGSLLQAANLTELITHNLQDYEALALALAQDPARLQALRQKMADTRGSMPLFDSASFTKDIEAVYESIRP